MAFEDMTVERTRDWVWVRSVVEDPEIFAAISNDTSNSLPREEALRRVDLVLSNPSTICLAVVEGDVRHGLFAFLRAEDGGFEMHTMLLPTCRGGKALRAGKLALTEMFNFADRIESFTPTRASLIMALRAGFKVVGSAGVWRSGGVVRPMERVAITKKEFSCR